MFKRPIKNNAHVYIMSFSTNGDIIFNTDDNDDYGEIQTSYIVNNTDIGKTYKVQSELPVQNSLTNSGYSYPFKQYNTGYNWTNSNSNLPNIWAMAISGSGKFAISGGWPGYIYYTNDYGQNWLLSYSTIDYWLSLSMSPDGRYAVATNGNGLVLSSSNYGQTWATSSGMLVRYVSMSAMQFAAASGTIYNRSSTLLSDNYGVSWRESNSGFPADVVKISTTGRFGLGIRTNSGNISGIWPVGIYYTNDYGENWSPSNFVGGGTWIDLAMSGSGQYAIASSAATMSIYYSSDYGITWTISTTSNGKIFENISMSISGRYALACSDGNYIYYSNDYGNTWTPSTSTLLSSSWGVPRISGNGKYALVSTFSSPGDIYFSTFYDINFANGNNLTSISFAEVNNATHTPMITTNGDVAIAVVNNTLIKTSDYGISWNTLTGANGLSNAAMTPNGKYILINIGTSIYLSSNYGSTFVLKMTNADGWGRNGISISSTGQYATVSSATGLIYFSNDYAVTWASFSGFTLSSNIGYAVALSQDGSRIITNAYQRDMKYATRTGTTWTTSQTWGTSNWTTDPGTVNQWTNVSSSATGQYAVAISWNSRIYVSSDYGNTFSPKGKSGSAKGVSVSDSGEYAIVADILDDGKLYYSNNYGNTWNTIVTTDTTWHDCAISGDGKYALGFGNSKIVFAKSNILRTTQTDLAYVLEPLLKYKTWTIARTNNNYKAITMSDSGKYILTCTGNSVDGRLYYSSNYGVSFTQFTIALSTTPTANNGRLKWTSVAMSADGKYAIACYNGGYTSENQSSLFNNGSLYYSSNYCVNWSTIGDSRNFLSAAMSGNGVIALVTDSNNVRISWNYGEQWNIIGSLTNRTNTYTLNSISYTWPNNSSGSYTSVAISSSGKYALVCYSVGGIYYSSDSCVTWTVAPRITDSITTQNTIANRDGAWRNWKHIAISGDGKYGIAADYNNAKLYLSSNYGVNWVMISSITSNFTCSSLSNTGKYACACSTTDLFYSNNFGESWITPPNCSGKNWTSVKVSGNGQYASGCVDGENVYICLATN